MDAIRCHNNIRYCNSHLILGMGKEPFGYSLMTCTCNQVVSTKEYIAVYNVFRVQLGQGTKKLCCDEDCALLVKPRYAHSWVKHHDREV